MCAELTSITQHRFEFNKHIAASHPSLLLNHFLSVENTQQQTDAVHLGTNLEQQNLLLYTTCKTKH